ncbi:MAG TPA: hypothetical protein VFD90_04125 [Gaiellales bacterium]|jgi:hypothetical protein|nr:hypothetical protein [Gaiellales bacterium]
MPRPDGRRAVNRRATFCIVVGACAVIVVAVVGVILYSFFNEDVVGISTGLVAYLTIFALVFCDAIVPFFPGETTLNAASVLASHGTLELGFVIAAGTLGAILGDSAWLRPRLHGPGVRAAPATCTRARMPRAEKPGTRPGTPAPARQTVDFGIGVVWAPDGQEPAGCRSARPKR